MQTQKMKDHEAKMKKKATDRDISEATHLWMKRWPCIILDGDPDRRLTRILYFLEAGGTAQTFAQPVELETIAEALLRKRSTPTTTPTTQC
jgi:hypothetical protein